MEVQPHPTCLLQGLWALPGSPGEEMWTESSFQGQKARLESENYPKRSTKRKRLLVSRDINDWQSKTQLLLCQKNHLSLLEKRVFSPTFHSCNHFYSTKLIKIYWVPSMCSALPYAGNPKDKKDHEVDFPWGLAAHLGKPFVFHECISLARQLLATWARHEESINVVHRRKRSCELDWSGTTSRRRWVSDEPAWNISAWLDGEEDVYSIPGGGNRGEGYLTRKTRACCGATTATLLRNGSKEIETLAVGDSAKKSGFNLQGKSESLGGFEQGSKMKRAVYSGE